MPYSPWMNKNLFLLLLLSIGPGLLCAELRVPHIFGDRMVLPRERSIPVWGQAVAGESVTVRFAGQSVETRAGGDGAWKLDLAPEEASHASRELTIASASDKLVYTNVLVGDVWLLGGQSNMEDTLDNIYHGDVEVLSAHHPSIRLITIPVAALPKPTTDFLPINEHNGWTGRYEEKGTWFTCSPERVARFSAIGYIFGRRLHLASQVPIGLIDASVGGTTVEAWTTRSSFTRLAGSQAVLGGWEAKVAAYDPLASIARKRAAWEKDTEKRKKAGQAPKPRPVAPDPDPAFDRNNPGASYNGMIAPLAGFPMRGALFNQGYNNALGGSARPKLYEQTLQAMIRDWRAIFGPEMPFGIVALTAGGQPQTEENFEQRMVDPAPYIREGQLRAYREMEHVGFAPAYDQQVPWYHPHKKLELGERIARWALATQYGLKLGWQPALCTQSEVQEDRIVLRFDRAIQTHDGRPFEGFSIAGEDRHFHPAFAEYLKTGKDDKGRDQVDRTRVVVSHPAVRVPLAVRYAWARNPLGNACNSQHHERILPVPSFRTDTWDWPEAPAKGSAGEQAHRKARKQAESWAKERASARAAGQ
jgi:sialate O-acetylesterase